MVRVHYFLNSGKLAFGDIAADFGLVRLLQLSNLSICLQWRSRSPLNDIFDSDGSSIYPWIDLSP